MNARVAGASPATSSLGRGDGVRLEGLAAVLGMLAWIGFGLITGIHLEDALITDRYAENLALGRGFAFNPGEPVLGTTTPLFTLVLAGLAALFGTESIPALARAVLVVAGVGTVLATARALRALAVGEAAAAIAAFAVALHPDVLWTTAGGMETMVVLCGMATSLWALARAKATTAAVISGLLVLVRPDAAVWAGLVLAALAVMRRRRVLWDVAAFALVVAPWMVYATVTFGSPVPASVTAKSVLVGAPDALRLMRPTTLRTYAPWIAGWLPFPWAGAATLVPFAFGLGVVIVGWIRLVRSGVRPAAWVLAAFPPAFAAVLYAGQAPRGFPWYGLPATWALLALFAIGAEAAARWIARRTPGGSWRIAQAGGFAAAIVLIGAWGAEVVRTVRYEKTFQENETATRRAIGHWIDAHARPDASVAMEAIGYQGTYARRRVIDLAGLVTPEVTRFRRTSASNAEVYRRTFDAFRPDYIVLRSFEVDHNRHRDGGPLFESAAAESSFHERYAEALRMRAPHPEIWGGGAALTVYQLRPAARGRHDSLEGGSL